MQIDIKFLSQRSKEIYQNGELLKYQTNGSSGFDIMATGIKDIKNKLEFAFNEDDDFYILKASHSVLVLSGFSCALNTLGYEMQIRSRSGLALKSNIVVLNSPGTVDNDYRGEIGVILINHSSEDFKICSGDRIAQAVISKIEQVDICIVENLDDTARGLGGFGSTGK